MTDKDIGGLVLALVGVWKEEGRLTAILAEAGPEQARACRERIKRNREVMEHAAIELVTQVLVDIHRIADAQEDIARNV